MVTREMVCRLKKCGVTAWDHSPLPTQMASHSLFFCMRIKCLNEIEVLSRSTKLVKGSWAYAHRC